MNADEHGWELAAGLSLRAARSADNLAAGSFADDPRKVLDALLAPEIGREASG
jgi:hypothetical protein